ncbi:hypothetical protein, partial [Paenibacillus algorifonticola]|uniref:hypothetical protein n=1 Tax=Paenibacillus algorifonticola TaxID=684063 RepID=UPI0018CE2B66
EKTPLTVTGFIISPVYRMGSISAAGQPLYFYGMQKAGDGLIVIASLAFFKPTKSKFILKSRGGLKP